MPWATVLSNLSFTPGAFSLAQQTYIESLLQDMYDTSPAAQGALDAAAGSKVLHITIAGTGLIAASDPGSNTIGINLSEVPQGRFFNSHGEFRALETSLTLVHEVIHVGPLLDDPLLNDEPSLNSADYNQRGPNLELQNTVATEMGWLDQVQPSYFAATLPGSPRASAVTDGKSYTEGNEIDTARLGTTGNDNLDHSQNTLRTRDLMLGIGGDDQIKAGVGVDYAYGGDGNDTIDGGDGDDRLFGEKGNDSILGGGGNDMLVGGGASGLSKGQDNGADTLVGGQGNDLLKGDGGSDSLSGEAGDDLIDVRSTKSSASDIVSIKLSAGGGKDYLVFSPDDSHTPTIRILLTDYTLGQVTFLSDQVVEDHPPSQDLVDSEGQLVVKLSDGTSLFLGALHGSEVAHNGDTDEGSYQGDANIEFVFSGGVTYELNSLFGDGGPATLQVVPSLDAYKNAPDNWPNVNLPPATPSTSSVSVTGGATSSILYGGDADDVLTAGPADDQLLGGKGDDDYKWQRGAGDIAVQDNARDAGDLLQLTGIASSAATFSRVGDDVLMTIAPTTPGGADGGEITLQDMFSGVEDVGVDRVVFSDVTRTADQIRQLLLTTPTPGPDTLQGGEDADTLSGGAGNDWLDGGSGDDVYVWARGDGDDAIDDWGGDSGDRLALTGIAPGNVHLRPLNAYDAVLVIDPSTPGGSDGGTIELRSVLTDWGDGVDEIAFTGGVVWEHADFATHLEIAPGTAGADFIYGGPGDDTLAGAGGADTVSGGEGNDTLVWSRGDGDDVLSDEGWNEGDRLVLHGVLPADVTFGAQDGNVMLIIAPSGGGDGGSITLIDSTQDFSWTGIDEIVFDNAVVWGEAELQAGLLAASQTAGADTIQGFLASETIIGGAGDDAIDGGLGDDVFRWSVGDGGDTLTEGQDGGDDRLELMDVSPGSVTVEQDGDDILLTIGSATLRLVNQALWDDGYGVETFVLDGQTWSAEDLMDQLAGA
jgi:Ca2+-binding RTX toxin-like protein